MMVGRHRREVSWLGTIGMCLLVSTMLIYWFLVRPLDERIQVLREQAIIDTSSKNTVKNAIVPYSAKTELDKFYQDFPEHAQWVPQLSILFSAAAQAGLILEAGNYHANTEEQGRLIRLEIDLPLTGTYIQIRHFIATVLSGIPAATLERVTFKRNAAYDNLVESNVGLVVYLARKN